ncbi:MAG TPA: DegQ family serine endoprotease [Gammaproteobacteria bacterium]|nr:DegQ family serine endoprotease [Gammaproteobacteria bacterium]
MKRLSRIFASAPLILTLFVGAAVVTIPARASLPTVDSQGHPVPSLAPMLQKVTPAVVNIASTGKVQVQQNPLLQDPFFRHFFNVPEQPQERKTESLGSGVIVDAKHGYILTNHHVIAHANKIMVTLRDGRQFKAKVIGDDKDTDIAVIQIKAKDLTALQLGNSEDLRVGDFVVAIGNPFGLGQTVTSGIVSALGRTGLGIEGYEDFIQTDASINPGNSGGALVNLNGKLIGINTAILSQSGGNIGIGFAIPIDMAHSVMEQLIKYGEVHRGRLGVQAQDLNPSLAKAFGITSRHRGAVITQVSPGSAAAKAGLKQGDVVTEVNGQPVRDASMLRLTIGLLRVGQEVKLKVVRDGKTHEINARLTAPKMTSASGGKINKYLAGAKLADITQGSQLYGKVQGVLVQGVAGGSPAWQAGLRPGDVIVSANRKPVKNIAELRSAVKREGSLLLNIQRGDGALFLYLQ